MNIIFTDIDGTLAVERDIPESAKSAIREARNNGDLVFICTGRSLGYVQNFFHEYADGFICSNGRIAYLNGEVIYDEPLSYEQIVHFARVVNDIGGDVTFFAEEEVWYAGDTSRLDHAMIIEASAFHDHIEPQMKVYNFGIFCQSDDQTSLVEDALKDECVINRHPGATHSDVSINGADKGTAILAVLKKLNVPVSHSYALGDGKNDIVMLKAAGHGIAMGNADPAVKQAAEYITDSIDHEGFAKALRHYHIIK